MTRATERPWHKELYDGNDIVDVLAADGSTVAECHYMTKNGNGSAIERSGDTIQANAALIVASVNEREGLRADRAALIACLRDIQAVAVGSADKCVCLFRLGEIQAKARTMLAGLDKP